MCIVMLRILKVTLMEKVIIIFMKKSTRNQKSINFFFYRLLSLWRKLCKKDHHDPTIEFNIQKIAKLIKYTETEEMEIDCSRN